ncbi:MAG: M28 family peptidase [Candidatus Eisenbacteria bacterium]|uniref:M28 family peptidase n=1 Tax=Eiseniibacteriota bacterium TaxID=2212470 RepID=A0A937XFM1_UNCEI|nr:M28 family peptidase [Candidatus Eisenbacteria bacterium]
MDRGGLARLAPLLGLLLAVPAAAAAFPEARAWEHLLAQCALGPRNPGSPGHRAGREYIAGVLRGAGGRVQEQSFRHTAPGIGHPVVLTNIVARFGPARAGGWLLGAHWDTRPWADLDPDHARRGEPILGANDGASGTAVLLALAESFAAEPPPVPVMLVFFDGEDLGRADRHEEFLAGSRYFAQHLPTPLPELGIVLDMVGSESMVLTLEQTVRQSFPDLAALVDGVACDLGLRSYLPGEGPAVYDDHVPLNEAGLRTLLLVDFRDPTWHTHADRPEHCSAASLGEAGRLVEQLVRGGYLR